jgi:hypothetical protein
MTGEEADRSGGTAVAPEAGCRGRRERLAWWSPPHRLSTTGWPPGRPSCTRREAPAMARPSTTGWPRKASCRDAGATESLQRCLAPGGCASAVQAGIPALARRLLPGRCARVPLVRALRGRVFDTVEINNSFYRLPEAADVRAPGPSVRRAGSCVAVKASRLPHPHEEAEGSRRSRSTAFFTRMRAVARRVTSGRCLYQLPPGWRLDLQRLEHFLHALPADVRHVLEFASRHGMRPTVYRAPGASRVSRCASTTCRARPRDGSASGRSSTSGFTARRAARYSGSYSASDRLEPGPAWLAGPGGAGA